MLSAPITEISARRGEVRAAAPVYTAAFCGYLMIADSRCQLVNACRCYGIEWKKVFASLFEKKRCSFLKKRTTKLLLFWDAMCL
jgi:hypothetical protein